MTTANPCFLLPQRSRAAEVVGGFASGFREHHSRISTQEMLLGTLLVVGLGLALVFAARLAYLAWWRWRHSSSGLFWRLCRAHRLSWPDRWLVWQAARALELAEPAAVFVVADRLTAPPLAALFPGDAARLACIGQRLLAQPPAREMVQVFPDLTTAVAPGASEPTGQVETRRPADRAAPTQPVATRSPLPPAAAKPDLAALGWLPGAAAPWGNVPESVSPAP